MTTKGATKLARDIVRKTEELNDLLREAAQMHLLVQIEHVEKSEMGEIKEGTIFEAPLPFTTLSVQVYEALDGTMTDDERNFKAHLDAAGKRMANLDRT